MYPSGAPWLKPSFHREGRSSIAAVLDTVTLEQGFPPHSSPLPCQHHSTLLHNHLHLHVALSRKKNGLSRGTFHKTVISRHASNFTKHKYLLCFGGPISGLSFSSFTPKKAGSAVVMPLSLCLPVGSKQLPGSFAVHSLCTSVWKETAATCGNRFTRLNGVITKYNTMWIILPMDT